MTPEKIGRYEIKSELGRGGMAIVYLAKDPRTDREVAIKVLPREFLFDPQFHTRFEREIKTVAQLEHPAIVPIHDVGEEDGQPYFVMRYMPGGSLSEWLQQGPIGLQDTARIIERLAKGLNYAHNKGIVHRDLKPGNILFDNNNDAFISDFGVAKLADAATSMTGSGVIGTPAYMSPEQAQSGHVDGRSDVYALGSIIFEMLTGHQPYKADTPMSVILKHITEPVPEILREHPEFPQAVDVVVKKAMSKEADKRYTNSLELAAALNKAAFGAEGNVTEAHVTRPGANAGQAAAANARTLAPTPTPRPATTPPALPKSGSASPKKWIGALIGVALILALLCAAGIVYVLRSKSSQVVPTFTPLPTYTPFPTQAAPLTVTPLPAGTTPQPPLQIPPVEFKPSQWEGTYLEPWGARVAMLLMVEKVNGSRFNGKFSWRFANACTALMSMNGEVVADVSAAPDQTRWSLHPDFALGNHNGLWLKWTQTENLGNPKCYVNTGDWWYAHVGPNGHMIGIRYMNDTDPKPANGTLDITLVK